MDPIPDTRTEIGLDPRLAANWDDRVPVHAASNDYGMQRFVDDPSHLSAVVAFDAPLIGDVSGLKLAHLQCHIGTDSVSLARLGASVTGVDFSEPALVEARRLAQACGADARFVLANVYDAAAACGATSTSCTPPSAPSPSSMTSIDGRRRWPGSCGRVAGSTSAISPLPVRL